MKPRRFPFDAAKFLKILILAFVIVWFIHFSRLVNSILNVNGNFVVTIDFTPENITYFKWSIVVAVLLILSVVGYRIVEEKQNLTTTVTELICKFARYVIFLFEIGLGLFIGSSLFAFKYGNFDPKITLAVEGFIAFVMLEGAKALIEKIEQESKSNASSGDGY